MDKHRKTCNFVKKNILRFACSKFRGKNVTLVDLCCGRGGDLFKWKFSRISKVIAIDNHQESIEEATKRYKENDIQLDVTFYVDTALNMSKYVVGPVHVISCNFALHYFNRGELCQLVVDISRTLVGGGYFIGTCIDGDRIREILENEKTIPNVDVRDNGDGTYGIKLYSLEESHLGKSYFDYRKDFDYSREYYLEKDVLETICRTNGLECITMKNMDGNHISELYFSFVFKKNV